MKLISPLAFIVLISCVPPKNESTEKTAATAFADSTTTAIPEVVDDEDINDEDHGDPGLAGLILDSTNLDSDVKQFISSLTQNGLTKLVSSSGEILLIQPGPGVSPTYRLTNALKELFEIKELDMLVSDSSLVPTTFYRLVWDACQVIEQMPEGIYLRDMDFSELVFTESDEEVNQQLQRFSANLRSASGTEILIKFRGKSEEELFVHLFCINSNGQLLLTVIDQRDCGA